MIAESTWFEGTPGNWPIVRTKFLFTRQQRPVRENDDIVTAFRDGQVALRRNRRTDGFTNAAKEIGYQGIRKGDLVVHAMDAFAGAVGVAEDDGKATPVYSVCTPKRADIFTPYYARLLRHMALSGFVESLSRGVRERSTEFRWAELSDVCLPVPPAAEQERIANFLDEQTARIDALIAEKGQLRIALDEFSAAQITVAVTKGISNGRRLVQSNAGWLGEVPADWKQSTVRRVCSRVTDGAHISPDLSSPDFPFVSTVDIANGWIGFETSLRASADCYEYLVRTGCRPVPNDVLFSKDGTIGRTAIVPKDAPDFVVASSLVILTPLLDQVIPGYLNYWLNNQLLKQYIELQLAGAALRRISVEKVARLPLLVPPLKEQSEIVQRLDDLTSRTTELRNHVTQHIDRLREYRASLISAAVTGQLDINSYKEAA